jgi:hypothetical protein
MSSVEAGQIGLWSCVYCEGVWLPQARGAALIAGQSAAIPEPPSPDQVAEGLLCPGCEATCFRWESTRHGCMYSCTACQSLYLPKPTVDSLGNRLGGGRWQIAERLGSLLTNGARTTDGVVTIAALIYLLLSS